MGLLDCFFRSKGAAVPEEFRRSCCGQAVLARLPRFVWEQIPGLQHPVIGGQLPAVVRVHLELAHLVAGDGNGGGANCPGVVPVGAGLRQGEVARLQPF